MPAELPVPGAALIAAWRSAAALLLVLAALAGTGRLVAEEAPPPAAPAVITTAGDFWLLGEPERKMPRPVRMEFTATYFDSHWNLLWGEAEGATFYLPTLGSTLPIKSGQRIRWEGTVVPSKGFDGKTLKVTVLADNVWPTPLPTAGRLDDIGALDARWVELEGHVVGQSDADPAHAVYQIMSDNRLVTLRLYISDTAPVPQLVGARVRVRCVYVATRDPAGKVAQVDCWTAQLTDIEVLDWLADDPRFKLPRTMIDRLESVAAAPWVRLIGKVRAQDSGKSLTLRDESGQFVIAAEQPEALPADTVIEIIGRPVLRDLGWTITDALYRKTGPGGAVYGRGLYGPGQAPLRLRLAEQVLQLSPDQAEKRHPVTLRGVVTWWDDRAQFFYLQDASSGVCIRREPGRAESLPVGTSVVISGVTVRGPSVPEVELLSATNLGTLALPPARKVSLEQALSGAEEGRRVEMRGYVRQVTQEEGWTRLDLTAATGEFMAYLPPDDSLNQLRGAMVRVQGVCVALTGSSQELAGVRLWVQNRQGVMVDEAGSADPFARAVQSIAGLRQFSVLQAPNTRVRVTGMTLLQQTGRYLYLQDGSGGLYVLTRESWATKPGEWIDVVGVPGWAGNRLVLREAVWRTAPAGSPIEPREIADPSRLDATLDTRLVRLRAILQQAGRKGAEHRLTLEANGRRFNATLPAEANWQPPEPGSVLTLTGVYVLEFDEYRQPDDFRLEMRHPADLVLLTRPPWWNVQRIFYMAGGLGLCSLLILAWVVALRRRLRAQAEQISRQLEKETRLHSELERTTRLESLGVLAGGIAHDFNNLLTAILGNLGLAAMDKRVMAAAGDCISEAERGARRARDITQQLLTFAKGGDPVRSAVLLPDVVSEAAGFARHGSRVRFEFDYPPDLPPADVDAGQISRVVHNLVINAVQAMPEGGIVRIGLVAVTLGPKEVGTLEPGHYIRMTVADTGRGIPAENLAMIFDPYYSTKAKSENSGLGLATVRSIIKKHNGHIEAESHVGQGTTFRIWLPAARENPAASAEAAPRPSPSAPARILVMDDEEVIRRVAGRMLSLAGHETVFTADGAEAVRTYLAARKGGRPFDLVIFDLTVPGGMGGKDALAELRKFDPEIRAVASSGYSSDPIMAHPADYGFRSALPKPYDIPDLIRAVGEARRP